MKPAVEENPFYISRIFIGAVILLALCIIIVIGISIYVGRNLTHPARCEIKENPDQYGLTYEDVSFNSQFDNVKLEGWWIPAKKETSGNDTQKAVIFSHGYGSSRDISSIHVLGLAKRLTSEGYNVLLFDFRNSGKSEGNLTSVGLFEKYDLLSAIEFAKKEKNINNIALIGWSAGAAVSINAGVEVPEVKAIIADSPFADLFEYLKENLPVWSNLPNFPFTPIIMKSMVMMYDLKPEEVSPYKSASKLEDRNLMLIHSKDDTSIGYENSQIISSYVKDKSKVEVWLTEKARHIESYLMEPQEYEKRVVDFLARCFR